MIYTKTKPDKMALPCVLFSSSVTDYKPHSLVKSVLRVEDLPEPIHVNTDIEGYEWQVETKYYSSKVLLCTTDKRTIGDQDFANSLQAFVHFFDPNEPSTFELTKAWLPYLAHIEPEIQILVCKTSKHSDSIDRRSTLTWCVENGFELVEVEPEEESDDEENDFPETTGIARIIQALHAHTWPNLVMKSSPTVQSPLLRQMMKEQHILNQQESNNSKLHSNTLELANESHPSAIVCSDEKNEEAGAESSLSSTSPQAHSNTLSSNKACQEHEHTVASTDRNPKEKAEEALENVVNSEDALSIENIDWTPFLGADAQENCDAPIAENDVGVEEFERLFMNLKVMKDRAEHLPPDARKKYAEKIAISFWKAVGGDEDEIGDLDTDSD